MGKMRRGQPWAGVGDDYEYESRLAIYRRRVDEFRRFLKNLNIEKIRLPLYLDILRDELSRRLGAY